MNDVVSWDSSGVVGTVGTGRVGAQQMVPICAGCGHRLVLHASIWSDEYWCIGWDGEHICGCVLFVRKDAYGAQDTDRRQGSQVRGGRGG